MKRLWWGVLAFIISGMFILPANALESVPTIPNKVAGPFIITGYSFSGSSLRYVQIFNNSASLASLDGWQMVTTSKSSPVSVVQHATIAGFLAPGKHIIAAVPGIIDRPSFILNFGPPGTTANLAVVSLIAPNNSGFNDESATVPNVGTSTVKETEGAFINYHVRRESSATTGNYLSSFSVIAVPESLRNDQLYVAPVSSQLQISEIYPDAPSCQPYDTSPLCQDYVKLFNPTMGPIDMSIYRLRTGTFGQSASSTNTRVLSGSIAAGQYVVIPLQLSSTGSWVWIEDVYGSVHYETSFTAYPSSSGYDNQAWAYEESSGAWRWTDTPTPMNIPSNFPIPPVINMCGELRISEIAANVADDDQFIELYNPSDGAIDTSGCALMTNRSSARYILSESTMNPYARTAIYIRDTGLTLTKTTSGTVYLLASDTSTEVRQVVYSELKQDTSWADVDSIWLQTYSITPGSENISQPHPACAEGYVWNDQAANCKKVTLIDSAVLNDCGPGKYRSPETNRCRSLEALANALTPCGIAEYRSPDTNRCRSLLSTASALIPCNAGQERNPDTNRCRSTAADDDLKPCADNQERNPVTNRCRNKPTSMTADFPVEAVAQTGEATIGWWAFGGVGTLAAGYAGWEWRREVSTWIRNRLPFGITKP